jgi:hypothetical protein
MVTTTVHEIRLSARIIIRNPRDRFPTRCISHPSSSITRRMVRLPSVRNIRMILPNSPSPDAVL